MEVKPAIEYITIRDTMHFTTLYLTDPLLIVTGVFLVTMAMTWIGHKFGRYLNKKITPTKEDSGIISSGLVGLLAFLLGFTFSMSAARLEKSRSIIAEEANCIGTAILRCDMYEEPDRTAFRVDFNSYLEARLAYFSHGADALQIEATNAASNAASKKLWARATALSHNPKLLAATNQMVPALNAMIDIVTTRNINSQSMVPDQIMWMLFILTGFNGFIVGFTINIFNLKSWIIMTLNALLTSLVIYIIIDLDRPKAGLITTAASDKAMTDLRKLLIDK
jgi:hypothetical protein